MVEYLLKFVSKKTYANDLLNGKLFMRPACYFHNLEAGQGDIREAADSHDFCIYKNSRVPIYCMYAIQTEDIVGGSVHISKRCIDDFGCENGYVVIVRFRDFEARLCELQSGGYEVDGGLVNYHRLTLEDTGELLCDNTVRNLFVKHPYFAYQKEFRVVVAREVYKINEPPKEHIDYWFSSNLRDIATCREVSALKHGDDYILTISGEGGIGAD